MHVPDLSLGCQGILVKRMNKETHFRPYIFVLCPYLQE